MTSAFKQIINKGFQISEGQIQAISQKYAIKSISVFGSILRDDFRSDSDIDFLVTFDENAAISLFDLMDLEADLSRLFNRDVDIVEPSALKNPIRRQAILKSCETLYAA
jgi:predicted nucleotidyltransferase